MLKGPLVTHIGVGELDHHWLKFYLTNIVSKIHLWYVKSNRIIFKRNSTCFHSRKSPYDCSLRGTAILFQWCKYPVNRKRLYKSGGFCFRKSEKTDRGSRSVLTPLGRATVSVSWQRYGAINYIAFFVKCSQKTPHSSP